jgi:hypothetical protein
METSEVILVLHFKELASQETLNYPVSVDKQFIPPKVSIQLQTYQFAEVCYTFIEQ